MENAVSGGGRRRAATKTSAEDQALDQIAKEAEARLAARRHARAEAREIRMRELERQQKEIEENADRVYDMYTDPVSRPPRIAANSVTSPRLNTSAQLNANNTYQSSRRSSEDSLEETGNIRDIRHEVKEVEEKFRKAMIQNAQLDNEKASFNYQVELLKDRLEDLEESHNQLQREHKEKCRSHEQLKRLSTKLKEDMECYKLQLEDRDQLIANHGLMIIDDEHDGVARRMLVTIESAQMLQQVGEGSLDVRLRRLTEERNDLTDQVRRLNLEVEEGRSRSASSTTEVTVNGIVDVDEVQRETNKQLADYRFKLQKAEQDVSTLQANVARLESQVIRYKAAAESSEKVEDELKVEKRKLQRECTQVHKPDEIDFWANNEETSENPHSVYVNGNGPTDEDIDKSSKHVSQTEEVDFWGNNEEMRDNAGSVFVNDNDLHTIISPANEDIDLSTNRITDAEEIDFWGHNKETINSKESNHNDDVSDEESSEDSCEKSESSEATSST